MGSPDTERQLRQLYNEVSELYEQVGELKVGLRRLTDRVNRLENRRALLNRLALLRATVTTAWTVAKDPWWPYAA